jgi:hypothetical protein
VGKAALEPSKRAVEDFPRLGPAWEGLTDDDVATRPGPPGHEAPFAFSGNRLCMPLLYGRAGHLTALFGAFSVRAVVKPQQPVHLGWLRSCKHPARGPRSHRGRGTYGRPQLELGVFASEDIAEGAEVLNYVGRPVRIVARPHCRFAAPLTHFILDSLTYSAPRFLERQCGRTLNLKFTGLTQNLGQLYGSL